MSEDKSYSLKQVRKAWGAGRAAAGAGAAKQSKLVGKWFADVSEQKEIGYAGQVVSEEGDGFFLLEFIEWLMGGLSGETKLVHIRDMSGYRFFETSDGLGEFFRPIIKRAEKKWAAEYEAKRQAAQQQPQPAAS